MWERVRRVVGVVFFGIEFWFTRFEIGRYFGWWWEGVVFRGVRDKISSLLGRMLFVDSREFIC